MKDSILAERSIELAVEAVNFYRWLVEEKREFVMSKQILCSATSVGANIHEAYYAVSRPDFISKMQIALKEAAETSYWLIVLQRTALFDNRFDHVRILCDDMQKMLTATLNTAKRTSRLDEK
ncbi:MAG: four helix bundle protein [Clostridia bacterium]|nr:four helix bundle protein [Clostridia bacterium]